MLLPSDASVEAAGLQLYKAATQWYHGPMHHPTRTPIPIPPFLTPACMQVSRNDIFIMSLHITLQCSDYAVTFH